LAIDGVGCIIEADRSGACAVWILRDREELRESILDRSESWPVTPFEIEEISRSLDYVSIVRSVVIIEVPAFAGCHWPRSIDFATDEHLRQVSGFQGCGAMIVLIAATVEMVAKTGFSDCSSLEIVRFERDSHRREINGFGRCPLTEIFSASAVEIIGLCTSHGCRFLSRIKFAQSARLCVIERFRSIGTGAMIQLPKYAEIRPGRSDT
jgi:hypothetical protein